jgi:dihydrodipicolinate synthase/N-acetylneuraminate lyase
MSINPLKPEPLRGIITPLVTPLLDQSTLDLDGLERLIEHVIAGGVHGIFLLGSTGEATSLDYRLQRQLVEAACGQIAGRVPALVGITDTRASGSLEIAEAAGSAGADAVVLAPPYYAPLGQRDLLAYFQRLVPQLPLPCYLYNIPSCTKTAIAVETLVAAAEMPGVIGLKDSSGDMGYFHRVRRALRHRPDFALLVGPEELLAEALFIGAHGGVNGGSNYYPRLFVSIYEAFQGGDFARMKVLHEEVIALSEAVYRADAYSGYYLKGLKATLSLMELCSGVMAEPSSGLDPNGRERVKRALIEAGLLQPSKLAAIA